MQSYSILGATGSIGQSTLDIIRQHPDRYDVFCLTGHRNSGLMSKLVREFEPALVVMADQEACDAVRKACPSSKSRFSHGDDALIEGAIASEVDVVMAAIVGAAGLPSSLAAVKAGKKVLLANKESLVTAGQLFMDAVADSGATLLPVDSEHNAIFQSLPERFDFGDASQGLSSIVLTASGGPFRGWTTEQLHDVTPEQACAHPNWDMGRKISVDSASLMNKGLELIEACWLFGVAESQVEVVIHPQSIVHSMVRYSDGSIIAQMGKPDMRTPIAHVMAWPERITSGVEPLDLTSMSELTFEKPDEKTFLNLRLARQAFTVGKNAAAALNASNEVAVAAFLANQIKFTDIARINQHVLAELVPETLESIDQILETDYVSRISAGNWLKKWGNG